MITSLRERGLIQDATNLDGLAKLLSTKKISFYCGFDPTAMSFHIGSLLPMITMRRLQLKGHQPIIVLGTATGMIGDPSGRSDERKFLDDETIEKNTNSLAKQFQKVLDFKGENKAIIVRNSDWMQHFSYISFLRDVGKYFSVNAMLSKESVKARLENREQGITYTEFSYMLLQAYDFYHLYKTENCFMQLGGSDQWGNITAGVDIIKRMESPLIQEAYGLTIPLLMNANGSKFGKSASGNIWLDASLTSPYIFYQYFLNTDDADVISRLKMFTFLELTEIAELAEQLKTSPEKRLAQKKLAESLTNMIHGKEETDKAIKASNVLFGGEISGLSKQALLEIFSDVPSIKIAKEDLSAPIIELFVKAKLADSKGNARKLIENGGAYLNNEKVTDIKQTVLEAQLIEGSLLILRSGKKNYTLVECML